MTRPPRLDGDPALPLGKAAGRRRAAVRNPFDSETPHEADAQPWQEALERLRARTAEEAATVAPTAGDPSELFELAERWIPEAARARLDAAIAKRPGADPFGISATTLRQVFPLLWALHRLWFRVSATHVDRIPADGPAIIVANHGGLLPFDGAMLATEILLNAPVPRLARPLVAHFVEELGPIHRLFRRAGAVIGRPEDCRRLLEAGELVLVFPEGVDGITKPMSDRYRLQPFHAGFAREAMRAGVPIVPVAIAGPDDQAPLLADIKPLARLLGLPAFPVTPTFPLFGPLGLLPLPVRYRIDVGHPFTEAAPPSAHELEAQAEAIAERSRLEIQRRLTHLRG